MRHRRHALRRRVQRLAVWARRLRLARGLAVVLFLAALVSGAVTFYVLSNPTPNSRAIWVLLNVDLVIILVLGVLVLRSGVRLWTERRTGRASSRLHVRLTVLFSAVAITPAILLAVFSALAFQLGFESWFDDKVSTAIEESQEVAEAYLKAHLNAIAGDAALMANDLNREWRRLPNQQVLNQFLSTLSLVRNLSEVVIFTADGTVIGRAGYTISLRFEQVPSFLIEQANKGEVVVMPGQANDRVRALVELAVPSTYLYIGRFVDPAVSDHIEKANAAVGEYLVFKAQSAHLQILYFLSYIVVSLLLLLAAIWMGMSIANRLARPIMQLVDAAEKVSEGNLAVRVPETLSSDEVALLGRAFNRMTTRLESQHRRLTAANEELDERRRFTETVLAGVSAGVIGVDPEGRIKLPNPSATALVGETLENWIGQPIGAVLPDLGALLTDARQRPDRPVEREIVLVTPARRSLTVLVRVAAECSEDGVTGFVFTFDDITELQAAQRKAAWADVARRIAHEIKNPLTPIQLSAERLKRKYLRQITEDPETFARCTDIIVRHVSDIGQMVDEFSAFARMPAPEIREADLAEIVSQAVFLQSSAYGRIAYETSLPAAPVRVACDSRQISQALTNLLKNAVEAIEGRERPPEGAPPLPEGRIRVTLSVTETGAAVALHDNGRGLPPDMEPMRLTEPYVTTRSKGTGLGLAIVKKILEDHGGTLILENAPEGGAVISFTLPLDPSAPSLAVRQDGAGTLLSEPLTLAKPFHGA
ncbi:sensor histidine kinase NtrY-like [Pararhodospirillum photometricum]|uniref:Nitrogen regulation protein n=1 Tax=Pararhodospirillum photometricum DSM 122 TaxID=1150469 RepID=H6SSG6_PARPM|nr:PAS domain-containing sensor histidine kinase [Pararhodospirillum photometricum]CCG07845.1 Sensor protein [Pararhodospirillum photometricum DSM 122]